MSDLWKELGYEQVGWFTFFLSSVLDNLTSTIVMVSLLRKLVKDPEQRRYTLCRIAFRHFMVFSVGAFVEYLGLAIDMRSSGKLPCVWVIYNLWMGVGLIRFLGAVVVIAANAGGAWTPIGDVTTTMLWIHGHISSVRTLQVKCCVWCFTDFPGIYCTCYIRFCCEHLVSFCALE